MTVFVLFLCLFYSLYSTYEWKYMVFVFLWPSGFIHALANGKILFIFMAKKYSIVCISFKISTWQGIPVLSIYYNKNWTKYVKDWVIPHCLYNMIWSKGGFVLRPRTNKRTGWKPGDLGGKLSLLLHDLPWLILFCVILFVLLISTNLLTVTINDYQLPLIFW